MRKFVKIWAKSEERLCKAVVLYENTSTHVLYRDSAKEKAVTKADLVDLFKKGLVLVSDGTGFYRPTDMVVESTKATLHVVEFSGSPAAAALRTFYSATEA